MGDGAMVANIAQGFQYLKAYASKNKKAMNDIAAEQDPQKVRRIGRANEKTNQEMGRNAVLGDVDLLVLPNQVGREVEVAHRKDSSRRDHLCVRKGPILGIWLHAARLSDRSDQEGGEYGRKGHLRGVQNGQRKPDSDSPERAEGRRFHGRHEDRGADRLQDMAVLGRVGNHGATREGVQDATELGKNPSEVREGGNGVYGFGPLKGASEGVSCMAIAGRGHSCAFSQGRRVDDTTDHRYDGKQEATVERQRKGRSDCVGSRGSGWRKNTGGRRFTAVPRGDEQSCSCQGSGGAPGTQKGEDGTNGGRKH